LREPSSFGNPQVNQYSSMSEDPYGTEDQFLHAAYPSMKDIIGSNLQPSERVVVTTRKSKDTVSPNSNGYDNPRSARISHIPNSVNPSLTFSEEDEETHR
jgi:hypothetical protein